MGGIPESILYIGFRPDILNLASSPNSTIANVQIVPPLAQTRSLGSYVLTGSVSEPLSTPIRVHVAELVSQVEEEAQLAVSLLEIVSGTFQELDFAGGSVLESAGKQMALITQVKNVLQRTVVIPELVSGVTVSESQRVMEENVLGVPKFDVSTFL